jgi:hypothetical protein
MTEVVITEEQFGQVNGKVAIITGKSPSRSGPGKKNTQLKEPQVVPAVSAKPS